MITQTRSRSSSPEMTSFQNIVVALHLSHGNSKAIGKQHTLDNRNPDSSADSVKRPTKRKGSAEDKDTKLAAAVSKHYEECPTAAAEIASKGSAARFRFLFGKDHSIRRRRRRSLSHSSQATNSASDMPADPSPPKMIPRPPVQRPLPSPQIWASQFPGGEAMRVHTPPLKADTVDGRPRGLFFDVNSQADKERGESSSSTHNSPTPRATTGAGSPGSKRTVNSNSRTRKQREW
ncbi:hypothetical protein V8F20_010050 [Naviculisporaceae sp. PSN 640]